MDYESYEAALELVMVEVEIVFAAAMLCVWIDLHVDNASGRKKVCAR